MATSAAVSLVEALQHIKELNMHTCHILTRTSAQQAALCPPPPSWHPPSCCLLAQDLPPVVLDFMKKSGYTKVGDWLLVSAPCRRRVPPEQPSI